MAYQLHACRLVAPHASITQPWRTHTAVASTLALVMARHSRQPLGAKPRALVVASEAHITLLMVCAMHTPTLLATIHSTLMQQTCAAVRSQKHLKQMSTSYVLHQRNLHSLDPLATLCCQWKDTERLLVAFNDAHKHKRVAAHSIMQHSGKQASNGNHHASDTASPPQTDTRVAQGRDSAIQQTGDAWMRQRPCRLHHP